MSEFTSIEFTAFAIAKIGSGQLVSVQLVILAAGDSSRMGFPKQLAQVKDKPLLEQVVEKSALHIQDSHVESL